MVSKYVKQFFIPPLVELYFIRLNHHDGYLEKLQAEFSQTTIYKDVLCVEHHGKEGNNKHYHLVIKTYRKNQALRVHLKSLFTLGKGNAHLSIKKWDGDSGALSYMFHEDTSEYETPIIVSQYSQAEIKELKSKSASVKKEIGTNSPAIVCRKIFDRLPKIDSVMYSRQAIVIEFMKYYHEVGAWQPNKFQLDRYYTNVQSMYYKYQQKQNTLKDKDHLFNSWYATMYGGVELGPPIDLSDFPEY